MCCKTARQLNKLFDLQLILEFTAWHSLSQCFHWHNEFTRQSGITARTKYTMLHATSNMEAFWSITVSDQFIINRGSANRCFIEVCHIIQKPVCLQLICWPVTHDEWKFNMERFTNLHGFPGCVGCVNDCHVPIKPTSLHSSTLWDAARLKETP